MVAGAAVAVLAIGVTVTVLLLARDEPPPAGLHTDDGLQTGDCVQFLPRQKTRDGEFEPVDVIPCDASEASFRMAAVMTGVDDATATRVCQEESKRVGHQLLLLFAGPRAGPGDAMCVETLRGSGGAPRPR